MKVGYIDTSFLLSIIFEDENYEKSIDVWNSLDSIYSSLLLDIESQINLYKYFIKKKKNRDLYSIKEKEQKELLTCISLKNIDNEVNLEIKNSDNLKRPRSLDSIHLATANILYKMNQKEIVLCSYDKEMNEVGKSLGFSII